MILALKEQSRVYFAHDTISKVDNALRYNKIKIWKSEMSEILIGGEGDPLTVNAAKEIVPFFYEFPTLKNVTEWIVSIKERCLASTNPWSQPITSFLIGGHGKLFVAQLDGTVIEVEAFEGIGIGREAGLAVLNVTREQDPEVRLINAISNAAYYYPGVGGEVKVKFI